MYQKIFKNILFPFYEKILRRRGTLDYLERMELVQWLPSDKIEELKWKRLKEILASAYEKVPYYRRLFDDHGIKPDEIGSYQNFARIPFLTKKIVQETGEDLISKDYRDERLLTNWTGGSTGEPIRFKFDHVTYEKRMAYSARNDRWAGWDYGIKELYIWGVRDTKDNLLLKIKKALYQVFLRRKTFNTYDFSRESFPSYVKEYNAWAPDLIVAYTGSLYNFAKYIEENGLEVHSPKSIITTAEQLYPHQRATVEKVFRTKVFNRYGSREFMNIAMECEAHNGMHLNSDNLIIEILKDNQPVAPGEAGELVITDLHNPVMPFIRYKIGDLAVPAEGTCSCGRGLPLISEVSGRTFDTFSTREGRCITGMLFTYHMQKFEGVSQFQAVQKSLDRIEIKVVKNNRFRDEDIKGIREEVRSQLGADIEVDIECVDTIPLQKSGKHRFTISEVPFDFHNTGGRS